MSQHAPQEIKLYAVLNADGAVVSKLYKVQGAAVTYLRRRASRYWGDDVTGWTVVEFTYDQTSTRTVPVKKV